MDDDNTGGCGGCAIVMLQMRLRVLDVGGVRVLTAVLAQSAALMSYEK